MQNPLFFDYTSAVANIETYYMQQDTTGLFGDYELSYIELVERLDRQGDEQEYVIRIAPLHVHIGTSMRLMTVTTEQSQQMLFLKFEVNDSFLVPRHLLFPNSPDHLTNKEMIYVEQLCQREDKSYVVRVAPADLHLDGSFSQIQVMDHWIIQWLPLRTPPKRPHNCRQKQLLGVLNSFDFTCKL
jgi:hypothetical protein